MNEIPDTPRFLKTAIVKYKYTVGLGWLIYNEVDGWDDLDNLAKIVDCSVGKLCNLLRTGKSYEEIINYDPVKEATEKATVVYGSKDIATDEEAMEGTTPEQKEMLEQWDNQYGET